MKVMGIGNNGHPEIVELPSNTNQSNELASIIKRLEHSGSDWEWARSAGSKYEINGNNSFQNLLTAVYDLAIYIQANTITDHDKAEFANLMKELRS